jgi:prepilin-type N-terminal cleavage/methylation domain-containing protein
MAGLRRILPRCRPAVADSSGFTLVELLLALVLGSALCLSILQALLWHAQSGGRLARQQRERAVQRRTLDLIRSELQRAGRVELQSGTALSSPCPLSGRTAVLQLLTPAGTIVYSLGAPPSSIWRGQVLMRCGPAYGLEGEPSSGASQNRVLLDALATGGFEVSRPAAGQLLLRLRQRFPLREGGSQEISTAVELATAEDANHPNGGYPNGG